VWSEDWGGGFNGSSTLERGDELKHVKFFVLDPCNQSAFLDARQ
jgi:hypothetical protein